MNLNKKENRETRAIWFEGNIPKNYVNNQQVLEAKGGEKFPFEWGGGILNEGVACVVAPRQEHKCRPGGTISN